ncbi:TIGR04438 family Trp-rich protein [Undibacterium piscinae]|jgi:small Trp-rich protein|uniref:TIGR04438 family Trp-rich protein n=1 Tax=Undibacterium piscinae TaxID=2495591 RepID=A0A6M4A8G5_9BURK|nr:TIGR04438 family Trp-rich protein [Undibacterium piscinae]
MPLIIAIFVLSLLKYLEVGFLEPVSWWWIIGLAVFAFLWFEFFERMLGLDKRKDHAHFEKMRKERIKRSFDTKKK